MSKSLLLTGPMLKPQQADSLRAQWFKTYSFPWIAFRSMSSRTGFPSGTTTFGQV